MSIFVFGSNLAGRHGRGSAREAVMKYGAVRGQGYGRQGDAFAIPTKGHRMEVLPLDTIRYYVDLFLIYARIHPELRFKVVAIGCGLAGYDPSQIKPMFAAATPNVILPPEFCDG